MTYAARVLTSTEARIALPGLGEQIEREGLSFSPVVFGSHRKPVGAIIPVALLDQLESILEDIAIAPLIEERIAAGEGDATVADIAANLGLDPADFE
ncbi:hypothetical protein DC31_02105 [Microbacterium sp. CH12i]|uniref:hypothetical protein n=1 Tax=Microbacterium sp. CH12i TaxID=1479651 RepID=UPI00046122ED|nr:hypothetical protein [Microbacterium sp. CH12i]KDA05211.1 hypothetical protein DC31_02105 [Microbacterium sp. CH12i]